MKEKTKRTALIAAVAAACVLAVAAVIVGESLKAAVWNGQMPHTANLAFGIAERALLTVAAACLMYIFGIAKTLRPRLRGGIIATIAGLAVALANFPFFCLADGSLEITADPSGFTLFVAHCLLVGLFEETAFRGFLFPMILDITAKKKHGVTLAVLLTSGLFALVHLLNLLQGAGIGATLLQVGYTFLIGCMCNVILIATQSLLAPVIVHALFDVGGTLTALGAASGSQWNGAAIAVMAVVSVIAAAYLAQRFFRHETAALSLLPEPPHSAEE